MKANTEKFDALVVNKTSGWHKKAGERVSNKAWQEIAFEIALKVIGHMRTNKVSQVSLAKCLGVSPQYINKILQGKENLTLETICRFEAALGIKLIEVSFSNLEPYELGLVNASSTSQFSANSVVTESVVWDSIDYEQVVNLQENVA